MYEYREVKPPPGWRAFQMIDEADRLRYFEQSARTRDGNSPDYRDIETDSPMRGVEV
jgi:hypothetical protein